jgi:hypothetical protein
MVGKAHKSHGARSGLCDGCSDGVPQIHFFQTEHKIQFRSCPMRFLGLYRLPREVLRKKKDRHRTSTMFRLGIIKLVHEIFKWSSYIFLN